MWENHYNWKLCRILNWNHNKCRIYIWRSKKLNKIQNNKNHKFEAAYITSKQVSSYTNVTEKTNQCRLLCFTYDQFYQTLWLQSNHLISSRKATINCYKWLSWGNDQTDIEVCLTSSFLGKDKMKIEHQIHGNLNKLANAY